MKRYQFIDDYDRLMAPTEALEGEYVKYKDLQELLDEIRKLTFSFDSRSKFEELVKELK